MSGKQAKYDVILNTEQAKAALKEVQHELIQVKTLRDKAAAEGDVKGFNVLNNQFKKLTSEAAKLEKQTHEVNDVLKNLSSSSIRELESALQKANKEWKAMKQNDPGFKEKQGQVLLLRQELDKATAQAKVHQSSMGKLADGFNKYFALATGAVAAVTGVLFSIKEMITRNAELSDSMADVAKSTGLSMSEVKDLNAELRKIDTRTSRKELLDLAYVAGKLGYSSKTDVLGFVRASDQIGVALSKDLGGNVEDAVNSLGKITDLFKVKGEFGIEQAMLKTGSAINALGAASTASESNIVDFTKRLGGVAPLAGISVQNIMGMAAALDQLGQQTETSSTAISQLLTKMAKKPGDFAKIAGIQASEFAKLLKTDANEALIMFLGGLQKNKGGLTELAEKFSDLGVDGSRSIGVIGALANNIDILRNSQKLSNVEFQKGTSLSNEFNIKNDNMAANLAKVGRGLMAAFVNSSVMSGLEKIVKGMSEWFKIPLAQKLDEERAKTNLLTNKLLEANISAATRNKLYSELNGIAPDVLKGIDKEAIAYDRLRKNLQEYNEQMIRKKAVAMADEIVSDDADKAAQFMVKKTELEDKLRNLMIVNVNPVKNFNAEIGKYLDDIVNNSYLTFEQKYRLFVKKVRDNSQTSLGGLQMTVENQMSYLWNEYNKYSALEKEATDKVNKATEKRESLAKGLSTAINDVTKSVEENTIANQANNLGNNGSESVKKLDGAYEQLIARISELDKEILRAIASGNSPLAEKLSIERNAAELLKKSIEEVKKALDNGWDMSQRDQGEIQSLVSKATSGVVSSKKPGESPLVKRDNTTNRQPEEKKGGWDEFTTSDKLSMAVDSAQQVADFEFQIQRDNNQRILDEQISSLNKRRDVELSNKKLTEEQKKAINAKYDAQERAIKKEAWEKQHKADITQAWINLALSVSKAAINTWPVPAIPMMAAATLAGGLQIDAITKQKAPEFYEGGYTDQNMNDRKPVGIVHANEFVASAGAVRNPSIKKIFDIIEYAQRTGTVSQINLPAVLEATNTFKGHYSGGYSSTNTATSPMVVQPSATMPVNTEYIATLKAHTEVMRMMIEDGLYTKISLLDLEKSQKKLSDIRKATEM